ncbi:YolD-like family protein [Halalkalibacter urbisdiaboli]|uniref:YolD-like family protein n=1 Tax=Halalkalibacter urbisdiaboli TaxID=1960589 RepID=UPI001FD8E00E|nr:YolD-like family protein [Halalkalibacter urbisdiaboli]
MNQHYLKRGNLLWESHRFIIAEHAERMRQQQGEKKKMPKHELDEQELQEIGFVVMDALRHTLDIRVVYWVDGFIEKLLEFQREWIYK